jgi:iron(II)-dependent oxidoreductase
MRRTTSTVEHGSSGQAVFRRVVLQVDWPSGHVTSRTATSSGVDQTVFADWYRRNRARSRALFDLLGDDTYYSQPIALRHPIVFYEGHLPAFSFNTLIKRALGRPSIDESLERLFARGIDPSDADDAAGRPRLEWPTRAEVHAFADEADRQVLAALTSGDLDRPGDPLLDRCEAPFAILEHEVMHQETLLYMWHRLPLDQKRKPAGYQPRVEGRVPVDEWIDIPPGRATLGVDRDAIPFGWDNEFSACRADVGAFSIGRHDITNAAFLEFVRAGGYETESLWRPDDWAWVQQERVAHPLFWERVNGSSRRSAGGAKGDLWQWRGMFDLVPLPLSWPVYVSYAEASAFARWRDARLPTEAEFQRAAYGTPEGSERRYPWSRQPSTAYSTFRAGIRSRQAVIPPAGARGASRTSLGTDGNGRARCSRPFPRSARCRRIRNTRRTSSTRSTS